MYNVFAFFFEIYQIKESLKMDEDEHHLLEVTIQMF